MSEPVSSELARAGGQAPLRRASAVVLSLAFFALAGTRLASLTEAAHHRHPEGLAAILQTPVVRAVAALVELALGALLLAIRPARAAAGALLWCSILGGVLVAMSVRGEPVHSCGCLGPRTFPIAAKLAILAGMTLLGILLVSSARDRRD